MKTFRPYSRTSNHPWWARVKRDGPAPAMFWLGRGRERVFHKRRAATITGQSSPEYRLSYMQGWLDASYRLKRKRVAS